MSQHTEEELKAAQSIYNQIHIVRTEAKHFREIQVNRTAWGPKGGSSSVSLRTEDGCAPILSLHETNGLKESPVSWHRRPLSEEQAEELVGRLQDLMAGLLSDGQGDGDAGGDDGAISGSGEFTASLRYDDGYSGSAMVRTLSHVPQEAYGLLRDAFESILTPDISSDERLRHVSDITYAVRKDAGAGMDMLSFTRYGEGDILYRHTWAGEVTADDGSRDFRMPVLHRVPMTEAEWDDLLPVIGFLDFDALGTPPEGDGTDGPDYARLTIYFDDGWELRCDDVTLDDERLRPLSDKVTEYEGRDNVPEVEVPAVPSPSSGSTSGGLLGRIGKMFGKCR